MNLTNEGTAIALISGGIGGVASYLYIAYDGFKALPTKSPSKSKELKKQRIFFLFLRTAFGAISGFIISLWFRDNYENGSLSIMKLAFISAIAGFSTTILVAVSTTVSRYICRSANAGKE